MTTETRYEHIVLNEKNVPIINGTRFKIIHLVMSHIYQGWNANELHEQYPHLTMGQIHSALAYYWDHKEEMEAAIEKSRQTAEELREQLESPELQARLKTKGFV